MIHSINQKEFSCEHCGCSEREHAERQCDYCGNGMCDACARSHDAIGDCPRNSACFSREVNTYIGTVLTRWGHVKLVQFAGPDDAGPDRRCIKIGDDARFTRSDARDLVRQLEDWLASRNKVNP